jgi:isopentenyl phosphate kinase
MEKLILIKLGGSLITDKSRPFCAREEVIRRLAREIKQAQSKLPNETKIIVGHGSGSFGHTVAAKYQTQKGLINKNSLRGLILVADAAIQINRIVIKNFLKENSPVFSFAPASFALSEKFEKKEIFLQPLEEALKRGLLPVIYGDVILDTKSGCAIFSSEKILDLIAQNLSQKFSQINVIYCGDTDGVYNEVGKTISKITPSNYQKVKKWIKGSSKTDVTGGMLHKVEEALGLVKKFKIETVIMNGNKAGNLKKALLGELKEGKTLISFQK